MPDDTDSPIDSLVLNEGLLDYSGHNRAALSFCDPGEFYVLLFTDEIYEIFLYLDGADPDTRIDGIQVSSSIGTLVENLIHFYSTPDGRIADSAEDIRLLDSWIEAFQSAADRLREAKAGATRS